jgi:YD repeat-containing protein
MNKHYLTFVAILLLSSCHKDDQHPNNPPSSCQILQIKNTDASGNISEFPNFTADFSYNAHGNPIRIVHADPKVAMPNYLFRYDQKNRVTDVIGYYESSDYGQPFEMWYRLKYDAKNRVIKDSAYYTGRIGDNPYNYDTRPGTPSEGIYTYDTQNRMVKSFQEGHWESRYVYTSQGNLDSVIERSTIYFPGVISTFHFVGYDNKVNFRRTHPIWQFLDRDYSMNNHYNTTASNKYNLPNHLVMIDRAYHNEFLKFYLSTLDIKYSCDQNSTSVVKY